MAGIFSYLFSAIFISAEVFLGKCARFLKNNHVDYIFNLINFSGAVFFFNFIYLTLT